MPQMFLPIFPAGVTNINYRLAFEKRDGRVAYFNGMMPVFSHDEHDVATFRMITSQFCCDGNATQAEISRAFGIPLISVKRAVKRYRKSGVRGFFEKRKARGPAVLTPAVLERSQQLLDDGCSPLDVADQLGIKRDTLMKAVRAGRLHMVKRNREARSERQDDDASTKSERSAVDSACALGIGATNVAGRVAASIGASGPPAIQFEPCLDIPNGGVLFGLPALLAVGLLKHTNRHFSLPDGYYSIESIFLLLAFMALARKKSIDHLRYCPPGEWGKLMGLDRIPEVRTLREKIGLLATDNRPTDWSAELCRDWMSDAPEEAGVLYVDGHVRVYHGEHWLICLAAI